MCRGRTRRDPIQQQARGSMSLSHAFTSVQRFHPHTFLERIRKRCSGAVSIFNSFYLAWPKITNQALQSVNEKICPETLTVAQMVTWPLLHGFFHKYIPCKTSIFCEAIHRATHFEGRVGRSVLVLSASEAAFSAEPACRAAGPLRLHLPRQSADGSLCPAPGDSCLQMQFYFFFSPKTRLSLSVFSEKKNSTRHDTDGHS